MGCAGCGKKYPGSSGGRGVRPLNRGVPSVVGRYRPPLGGRKKVYPTPPPTAPDPVQIIPTDVKTDSSEH